MNYFVVTATASIFLSTASHAFLPARQAAVVPAVVPCIRSKTCIFQQQQLFDQDGNPIYDQYGNPMYYDPQQQQQQQYYDEGQQQQLNYAQDQEQQQYLEQQQQQQQSDPSPLIISDDMQGEMARATSGVELGGMDYLALARQRAAARVDSNNAQSTAEDWFDMAEAKKRELGDVDLKVDWENWDPADAELDEREATEGANNASNDVPMEQYEGGAMITEGGLVIDNVEGEDGPQLLL